jgi:hypothetical protein
MRRLIKYPKAYCGLLSVRHGDGLLVPKHKPPAANEGVSSAAFGFFPMDPQSGCRKHECIVGWQIFPLLAMRRRKSRFFGDLPGNPPCHAERVKKL